MRLQQYSRRALLTSLALVAALARGADEEVSDDVLYDRVNRILITDRDLGARPLQVQVENGVVTVSGFV